MASEHFDVAIVGGAVMGSATAFFLAEHPDFCGRIAVLEKDPTYTNAASSRSTSGFRQQFSTAVNIQLSRFSAEFIEAADERLSLAGERPGLTTNMSGYLYLGGAEHLDAFTQNNKLQRTLGVDVALLDPTELARRFPWLKLEGVVVGSLGLSGEGWFDGYLLMNAFRHKARYLGVDYRRERVVSVEARAGGGFEIGMEGGAALRADRLVNTAGTFAPRIAAMVGLPVPVKAVKQNVFTFQSPFHLPGMPYLFTPDGLFCRPEGGDYIAGLELRPEQDEIDLVDMEVEYSLFDEQVWPKLAQWVVGFDQVRFKGAWAGHYDLSLFDHNPFIGGTAALPGYYMATGFSGHGIMQSPGVGRALSELIIFGTYRTLDLSELSYDRLASKTPVFEAVQY